MMIGDLVKTLRRKQRLLLGQMRANGGETFEGLRHDEAVVEAPAKVRRDDKIERVHVALEQSAREAPQQLVALRSGRNDG